MSRIKAGLKLGFALLEMGCLIYGAVWFWGWNMQLYGKLLALRGVPLVLIAVGCPLVMAVMVRMEFRMEAWEDKGRYRPLHWAFFRRNINFLPMEYRFLRWPFLALLYANLPVLAWLEEFIFRAGMGTHPQRTLWQALWRSIAFGYAHMLGGSTVGNCIILSFGGLWFSVLFAYGGLELATLGHLFSNVIGLTTMLVYWARTGINPFVPRPRSAP